LPGHPAWGCDKPEALPPPAPEVTVLKVEAKNTPVTYEYVGILASSQQVEVRARVDGFLDKRLYIEGNIVKQGQVMFQMDVKPFQAQLDAAQSALAEQQAKLWTAQANLKCIAAFRGRMRSGHLRSKGDVNNYLKIRTRTGRLRVALALLEARNRRNMDRHGYVNNESSQQVSQKLR
jgi:multidrug efflux pump subunit AcrA (membrane-fusion protein)